MAGRNSNKSRTSRKAAIVPEGYKSNLPRIRWKPEEKTELARLVRNYNQKRRRAIARGIPESALPGVVRGRELRDKIITTRKDLKREIGELERFMKADLNELNEYRNIKLTQYEVQEAERLAKIGNRAVAKERKRLEKLGVTSFGVDTGLTVGIMGNIENGTLQPVNVNIGNKGRYEWNRFMDMLRKRADPEYINKMNYQLQRNYLTGLFRTMGTNPYTAFIANEILKMSPEQFITKYYKDTDVSRIEYIYDENIDERNERLAEIFHYYTGKDLEDVETTNFNADNLSDDTVKFMEDYSRKENELRQL